ncbi:MAG: hypothetical protein ACMUIA_06755, partial [bacterium]
IPNLNGRIKPPAKGINLQDKSFHGLFIRILNHPLDEGSEPQINLSLDIDPVDKILLIPRFPISFRSEDSTCNCGGKEDK